ncbi:MAG: PstS family phosphate ABC transporter substrate-binding protein [Fimbriimonadales bacterium]|nr:PstS family phosphate ABC transporter substrate-binding protein [Fimbriimonadales bacterium]
MATIVIKGSDTMVLLNQRWAAAYAKVNPQTAITVDGGGTNVGIRALLEGRANICAASRRFLTEEREQARSRGVVAHETPVALDGLAIAVHASNPVAQLTLEQLRQIYLGRLTNWSQVGGENAPIVAFSRDANSGTHDFFKQRVLRARAWGRNVRFLATTADEARELARTPNAIAYGGAAYFANRTELKILRIAPRADNEAYLPDLPSVRARRYPIWRFLYYYTDGKPRGAVAEFIRWATSAEGQALAAESGYFPL